MESRILLVDDDIDILEFMEYNLAKAGFIVRTVQDSSKAIEQAIQFKPDLVILDIMMPHIDGIELCEQFRKHDLLNQTLIAFLTARSEDYSQIAGFDAGADDYIAKPIKPKVLISRVKALLKRASGMDKTSPEQSNILEFKHLTINKESYTVTVKGIETHLPKKEFEILYLLATVPGKVFLREEIYTCVWGSDVIVGDRTIDVHIRKLREAVGVEKIQTVKGVGYKFVE